jgi:hypothetical protein
MGKAKSEKLKGEIRLKAVRLKTVRWGRKGGKSEGSNQQSGAKTRVGSQGSEVGSQGEENQRSG